MPNLVALRQTIWANTEVPISGLLAPGFLIGAWLTAKTLPSLRCMTVPWSLGVPKTEHIALAYLGKGAQYLTRPSLYLTPPFAYLA